MGNKGAFITLKGNDMLPNFTTYEAVVSTVFLIISLHSICLIAMNFLFKCMFFFFSHIQM